ncbi:MAG: DUF4375 domain-containing protein [Prochloraceae cyanobacterium]
MTDRVFELEIASSFWEKYEDEKEIPKWIATIVEFENWEYTRIAFLKPEPIANLPDRIIFNTSYKILAEMEFVHNNAGWPIVSKKMLNKLLEVGNFLYQSIPITMVDNDIEKNDFIAIQLLEHLDIFDCDRSDRELESNRKTLINLDKLVLKQPQNGFPPIFRVKTIPSRLFVSSEAREALENGDIRGLEFIALEEFEFDLLDTLKFDYRVEITRAEFAKLNNSYSEPESLLLEYSEIFDLEGVEGYFEEEFETYKFSVLTPGQKALSALNEFIAEVNNGGIAQFFWNESEFIWQQVLVGLELIDDRIMVEAYKKELQKYLNNQTQLEEIRSQYWQTNDLKYYSNFAKTYQSLLPSYENFRDIFYSDRDRIPEKLVNYINSHAEEFVIFID